MAPTIVTFTDEHMSREYIGWLNNPEIVRYSEQRHIEHDMSTCQQYLAHIREVGELWAILVDELHVGNISAHMDWNNRRADISIIIGDYQGQGIGPQAIMMTCDHLKKFGYRKVTMGCMSKNKAMIKAGEKAGFKIEAIRQGFFIWEKQIVSLVEMGKSL